MKAKYAREIRKGIDMGRRVKEYARDSGRSIVLVYMTALDTLRDGEFDTLASTAFVRTYHHKKGHRTR